MDDQTVKVNKTVTNTSTEGLDMSKIGRAGPLTFYPCPERSHDKQHVHVPPDKQAELMHWHYCLGHMSFQKLKALAKIGKIPKHLANVLASLCRLCVQSHD